tara:strand:+ start:10578 stop:10745 length:168 start_codon:yes stop_codon:yes gene_type:complete
MNDTLEEAVNVAALVALLNVKFVENYDNPEKAEVLTEVLNDVKLMFQPVVSDEVH